MDAAGPEPLTQAAFFQQQAGEAWQAGQAALRDGDLQQALFWHERAWRLAPDDPATALALAAARLRGGDALAALPLLERVTQRVDSREALLLLAAARHRAGQPSQAAAALAAMLASHLVTPTPELAGLADTLVRALRRPGWCGVAPNGHAMIHLAEGRADIALDGKPWRARGPVPPHAAELTVTVAGRPCLGSPVDLRRARRVEGVVAAVDGGLSGWAWQPGNPDADPVLRIVAADGRGGFEVTATDPDIPATGPLSRPRGFHVPAARLAGLRRPLLVLASDGSDLAGSPLDPDAAQRAAAAIARAVAARYPLRGKPTEGDDPLLHAAAAATLRGPAAAAPLAPTRPAAVVIPAYRGLDTTRACLDSVLASVPAGTTLVVVDDATPEPALAALLDDLAAAGRIRLLRHQVNHGFPSSANAGMRLAARLAPGADLVLLNSDTVVTPGWLAGLREAVHAAPDIGTATPLSNDATILSYPDPASTNRPPAALRQLASLAARANPGIAIDIPTAVGFCMYLRRECLAATGLFREDVFAQGYGEENDFCLRATHLGWRHIGVPGVFVAHAGGQSFGAATSPLIARNLAVLEQLHPGYRAVIAAFQHADPLAEPRRRLDALRWQAARLKANGRAKSAEGAVLLVTHDSGGGVERVVRTRCAALHQAGRRAILLRPVPDRHRAGAQGGQAYRPGLLQLEDGDGTAYPNLVFALPRELPAVVRLLRADRPALMEIHHLLGHDHTVLRLAALLAIPEEIHLHDYAWFCPRVTLIGPAGRYCGEPDDPRDCEACVADAGRAIEEDISVAALRARSARDLARARRVTAPSADSAARLRRHFPAITAELAPLEDDAAAIAAGRALPPTLQRPGERRRVAIIGGIGTEKGYDILLACARDAEKRDLPLEFTLVGHSVDDRRLLDTGRVAVTGGYREGEGEVLVRAQRPHLAWLPSLWPETWCFTLGVAWRAGLRVAVFDIGAPCERVRATGHGWVLPLGLPAAAINNALLAMKP